jgi:hypothetical protein
MLEKWEVQVPASLFFNYLLHFWGFINDILYFILMGQLL